jgi:hypothetical protein
MRSVQLHVSQRDHQISVVLEDRSVAWRLAIEKDEWPVVDTCVTSSLGDHLADRIATAGRDHPDIETEPR